MMVVKRNYYRQSLPAPTGSDKECEQCGVSKPIAMFNRNMRHRESFNPICRQCQFNRCGLGRRRPEVKSND